MPIYEFKCCKCQEEFESLVFKSDEKVNCPKCDHDQVERLMSGFAHKSAGGKMVSSSSGCASCSGGSCSSCH
jgi:putative FmdB family regulatory protein